MILKLNYKRIVELFLVVLFMGGMTACNNDEDVFGPGADTPSGPSNPSAPSTPVSYYRPKTSESKATFDQVYQYMPAPGQFINELKTGGFDSTHTTQEAANLYAKERLDKGIWVSLGGFGCNRQFVQQFVRTRYCMGNARRKWRRIAQRYVVRTTR